MRPAADTRTRMATRKATSPGTRGGAPVEASRQVTALGSRKQTGYNLENFPSAPTTGDLLRNFVSEGEREEGEREGEEGREA